jgi:CRP-like cAMP-binding protein
MDEQILIKNEYSTRRENRFSDERQNYARKLENANSLFVGRPEKTTTNKLLANLSAEKSFHNLLRVAESVEFTTRDFIYQAGEKIRYVYFPETMVASEFQILEDGRTVELAMIGNDGLIGAFPFCPDRNAPNWIQPIIPGTALKVEAEIIARVFNTARDFPALTAPYFENYVKQISQKAVCLCFHHIEARLCTWLLMLTERLDEDKLRLTHEQIARSIGVHRPSVSQIAKSIREKGIIDYRRGEIIITNRRKLEDLACECFGQLAEDFH